MLLARLAQSPSWQYAGFHPEVERVAAIIERDDAPPGQRQSTAEALSNGMVKLHREHFGRGPGSARTVIAGHDFMVCVLEDILTPVEHTLIRVGKTEQVRETRLMHQLAVESEYVEVAERVTGFKVVGFASTVTFEPDRAIEIFFLGPESGADETPPAS